MADDRRNEAISSSRQPSQIVPPANRENARGKERRPAVMAISRVSTSPAKAGFQLNVLSSGNSSQAVRQINRIDRQQDRRRFIWLQFEIPRMLDHPINWKAFSL